MTKKGDRMWRRNNLYTVKVQPKLWRLKEDLEWVNDKLRITYVVPKGFYTDGASAPKATYAFCSPMTGRMTEAAVLHDYFYSIDCVYDMDRIIADKLFYEAMRTDGTNYFIAKAMYRSVRVFGKKSWKSMASIDKLKLGSKKYY
jgi:hypothetical protein